MIIIMFVDMIDPTLKLSPHNLPCSQEVHLEPKDYRQVPYLLKKEHNVTKILYYAQW